MNKVYLVTMITLLFCTTAKAEPAYELTYKKYRNSIRMAAAELGVNPFAICIQGEGNYFNETGTFGHTKKVHINCRHNLPTESSVSIAQSHYIKLTYSMGGDVVRVRMGTTNAMHFANITLRDTEDKDGLFRAKQWYKNRVLQMKFRFKDRKLMSYSLYDESGNIIKSF